MKPILSLSYHNILDRTLAHANQPVDFYYFIVSPKPIGFKIVPPTMVKVTISTDTYDDVLFSYQSPKGAWLRPMPTCFKRSAYYYATLEEAEQYFQIALQNTKEHFTNVIDSANIALIEINKY